MQPNEKRTVFGSVEMVRLPAVNSNLFAVKIDTGAWSGALHSTGIYEQDGTLYFTPLGNANLATTTNQYEKRTVRSSSGVSEDRYMVPLELEIKGKNYHTTVSLSDRTLMSREMLLGRKFLIENNILVDVALTVDNDHEAEKFL